MNKIAFSLFILVINGLLPSCDDGGGSKKTVDTSCLVLQPIRINTRNSAVSVLFGVENCKGEPVPYGMLTAEDFLIGEDGQPLSSETHLEILQGRGQAVFVNLLLDMSDSTRSNLTELISGAKKFISTVLVDNALDVKIAIQAFDGSANLVNLQLPSSDVALLNTKLDGLLTYSAEDGASTNLNGALYDSLLALQQSQLAYINRNFNGVSTIGYIVLFTDGGDTAGRVDALITHNNVVAARLTDGTPTSLPPVLTYAVALKGADYDQEALRYLIGGAVGQPNSYVVEADSGAQLEATFARIATRISGQVESTYLLAYCSSKRSGTSTVNIAVKPERAGTANELSFPFSAEGFGPGCDAGYFRTACDGLECGGFNCGGCDDAISRCEGSTLQCTNYCLLFDSCNGETITNPNGYEMVCSFGDEVTECADQCVDTDRDEANCGACGNVCEADGSWCEGGQCLCSGDRIGCGSVCVDNLTDVNHCGTCGNVCPAEVACVEGQCQCPGGDVACSGVCVDTLTDVSHCGACGNACAAGATCGGGQCLCNASTPCDGADLHGETCQSLSYTAGTLACAPTCELDVSACTAACGDGVINSGEECDGELLDDQTCATQGFGPGVLLCSEDCSAFVTTGCNPCGNDMVNSPEVCDGTALDGQTCISQGFGPGTLACNDTCSAFITTGCSLVNMIQIPGGTFHRDEISANTSTVTAFKMSATEITRKQFLAVMGTDPSSTYYSSGTNNPVQQINWYHAIAFCNKLSLLEGRTPVYAVSGVDFTMLNYASIPTTDNANWNNVTANWAADGYRLPTEMEWMWAAMGAIDNYRKQFAGDSYGNFIGDYVVFGYGSNEFGRTLTQRTNPVGSKLPNELGLFDLSGNAAEFVWDGYGAYPEGALTDYRGAGTISNRIIRGGSWINDSFDCTVFTRGYSWPNWVNRHYGIRVVLQ